MSVEELAELREQLTRKGGGVPAKDSLRAFLRLSREVRIRNPEDVAAFGTMLLKHYRHKLAEEEREWTHRAASRQLRAAVPSRPPSPRQAALLARCARLRAVWALHEQVAVALLECGSMPAALELVKAVLLKFPDSVRAKRLQGLYYEAAGKPARARQVYEDVVREAPHDDVVPKQLAAMYRGAGDLPAAVDVLRTYLDHYSNDREAWEELADVYLEASMYRQAAFCLEEVLSMGVLAPLALVKYADALASAGGAAQLRTARAYYSKALQVTGGRSVRALYGLVAVCSQLPDKEAAPGGPANEELCAAAAQALLDAYAAEAPGKLPVVQQALRKHLRD